MDTRWVEIYFGRKTAVERLWTAYPSIDQQQQSDVGSYSAFDLNTLPPILNDLIEQGWRLVLPFKRLSLGDTQNPPDDPRTTNRLEACEHVIFEFRRLDD